MKRLCAALLVSLCVAVPSEAAEITRIASSFEPDDPFGLYLGAQYVRDQRRTALVREQHTGEGLAEVAELRHLMVENRLDLDLRVGLWVDLELRYTLPIIFSRDQTWDYAAGSGPDRASVTNNCVQANGQPYDPTCSTTGAGATPLFDVPAQSFRGGLGNMRFGLTYALFNERRDPSKPMWLLGIDYEAPTADLWDPTAPTARDARGGVGDRFHRYTFFTAFSKKLGAADPYVKVHYTLPWRGPGWYSNCQNPDPRNMSIPENCNTGHWTRNQVGTVAPHTGGVMFGSEFVPWEQGPHQKVAIDLRLITHYVGPGRHYNELTDVLGKTLTTDDYLEVGGGLGLTAWAAEYLGFTFRGTLLYATDHTVTDEQLGEDLTGPEGRPNGGISFDQPVELNPNYDARVDAPGRRFRTRDSYNWRIDVGATFNF